MGEKGAPVGPGLSSPRALNAFPRAQAGLVLGSPVPQWNLGSLPAEIPGPACGFSMGLSHHGREGRKRELGKQADVASPPQAGPRAPF